MIPRLYKWLLISNSSQSRLFNVNQFGHLSANLYVTHPKKGKNAQRVKSKHFSLEAINNH